MFEFAIIKPLEMGGLIDRLIQENPKTIEEANVISNEYDLEIVTYDQFVNSIDAEMKKGIPPKNMYMFGPGCGIHFTVMNKFTNKMNLVVVYKDFIKFLTKMAPDQLKKVIKSILGHESIHFQQYGKMGNDPNKYEVDTTDTKKYFGHHSEVMAYAYSIIDELKNVENRSKESIIKIIRSGEARSHRILSEYYHLFEKGNTTRKKLNKYLYLYIDELFKEE